MTKNSLSRNPSDERRRHLKINTVVIFLHQKCEILLSAVFQFLTQRLLMKLLCGDVREKGLPIENVMENKSKNHCRDFETLLKKTHWQKMDLTFWIREESICVLRFWKPSSIMIEKHTFVSKSLDVFYLTGICVLTAGIMLVPTVASTDGYFSMRIAKDLTFWKSRRCSNQMDTH